MAFGHAGLDWQKYVRTDPALLRPAEVDHLIGDASKAKRVARLGADGDVRGLIAMMVDADLGACRRRRLRSGRTGARLSRSEDQSCT